MNREQKEFITTFYKVCQQNGRAYNNICPIAVTAQAVNESGWGKSSLASKHHNYFGLKTGRTWHGESVKLKTKEEYQKGKLVTIYADFRCYPDLESGVKGYYEFINTKRYANLKNIKDPYTYVSLIKQDGYATSTKYVTRVMNVVDTIRNYLIATDVIDGEYGNGEERILKLTMAGYNYQNVQKCVNELLRDKIYELDISRIK